VATRKALLSNLQQASNVYFDRVTGDLLLSTIETQEDKIYIIQGFVAPPPLQG